MRRFATAAALALALVGCTPAATEAPFDRPTSSPSAQSLPSTEPPAGAPTVSSSAASAGRPAPVRFDSDAALEDVRHLAERIGPREATSANFRRAADLVEGRLTKLGYRVRRTRVEVPAGNSWGTPVRRGTSVNVVAEPPGFDPRRPHVVIGAHLDTIPVSPGAEDNASGIAVLLELARLSMLDPQKPPAQLIAFGAEEPRGEGDRWHHFGSQQYVADLPAAQRRAIRAMVSLDRVGVRAGYVPVCTGGPNGASAGRALRAAGRSADITTRSCVNRSSDHWSYDKAGVPAVRLGSIPYPGYHSRQDVFSVVDRRQLDRVGRLMWTWLAGLD
jgi:hypothetical protein